MNRPRNLVLGGRLAQALSVISVLGAIGAMVGTTIYRYHHDHTALNVAAPVFGFFLVLLLVLAGASCASVVAAGRTLRGAPNSRDVLVGLGGAGLLLAVLVAVVAFARGLPLAGAVAVTWAVVTAVSLALVSGREANDWLLARSPWRTLGAWLRANLIAFLGVLVMLYLYLPNVVVAAMSFNQPQGKRTVYQWNAFTTSNWVHVCKPDGMCASVVTSLWIGVVATVIATIIGTLAAFALVRYRFSARSASNVVVFLPMATPEIVMGSSLLALFVALGLGGHLGRTTIIIAHVMFCLSYVVTTVKARLAGMNETLEQAAMDLYATESQTFWRVTFPLVFPGILSAALLSFSLSFDDFIVTNLNAGTTTTFPMYVWGAAQRGLPMQVNVIGTVMFLIAISVVAVGELGARRRSKVA